MTFECFSDAFLGLRELKTGVTHSRHIKCVATALQILCRIRDSIVSLLLSCQHQRTPLHFAALFGEDSTCTVLMSNGAAVDTRDEASRRLMRLLAAFLPLKIQRFGMR